ncbi:hypothetical protein B0H14DRAFT_2691384 [Mycena olivaceomarginata]|nr:hypothetical protein B0H14DRAFT_2691384 [Mycena olivaceomarginata]
MIVPQDTPKSARLAAESESTATESPPAYEPPLFIAPTDIKPANYISLTPRFNGVKGTFVLDPTLRLPPSMQPHSDKLHLGISASLPSGSKTRMEVSSKMGSTKLVLHAPECRAPLTVNVDSRLGESTLLLPRSFRGPIRLSNTLGEITLSAALRAATVSFGDRMFIGEWKEEEVKQKVWPGDELVVNSLLGSIYVGYNDEKTKA